MRAYSQVMVPTWPEGHVLLVPTQSVTVSVEGAGQAAQVLLLTVQALHGLTVSTGASQASGQV